MLLKRKRQCNKLFKLAIFLLTFGIFSCQPEKAFALFEITDGSSNPLTSGTLLNNLTSTEPSYTVDSSMLPGEMFTSTYKIENTGESDFVYDMRVSNLSGDLCENLNIKIREDDKNGTIILGSPKVSIDEFYSSGGFAPENMATSESQDYFVELAVNETAHPDLSGTSCDFDMNVMSWRAGSNYGTGYFDVTSIRNSVSTGDWHNRSEYTKWHYQYLGEVVESDTELTSYSYWYTAASEFYPNGNEGLLINEYDCDLNEESCSGTSITNGHSEKFSIYDETSASMYCVSDSSLGAFSICDHSADSKVDNLNPRHMYKITYYWNSGSTPEMHNDKYYVAIIGTSSRKSSLKGNNSGDGAKNSNSFANYTLGSTENFVDQLEICLNDTICGPFPMDVADGPIAGPLPCVIEETYLVGQMEQNGMNNPYDEFNYPEKNLAVEQPLFADPFILGSSNDSEWPWNSNAALGYADDFTVNYNFTGSTGRFAYITIGWSPGQSTTSDSKEVYVNGDLIDSVSATGSPTGTYGPLQEFSTPEFPLFNGLNTINLKHPTGDGSYWDYFKLKVYADECSKS